MVESLFGICQPFRKLVVLLSIMLVGLTMAFSFEFATVALTAPETHYLQVVGIIAVIKGMIIYLTREAFKMYWEGRNA